jgi:glycosyltransferase involved in cell wall biosynthesis
MAFDPDKHQPGLVSVIIPAYNRAEMARRAVESVLKQTYRDVQLLLVDDGSKDNTRAVFENYPGVEYHWQSNARQAAARNTGLSFAKGEFIAYLDSDDWWHPDYLTETIAALQRSKVGFAFSGSQTVVTVAGSESPPEPALGKDKVLARFCTQRDGDWFFLTPERTRELMLEHCPVTPSGFVLRRNCHRHMWNPELLYAEDILLLLEIILSEKPACVFTLKPLWFKCVHETNELDRIGASTEEQRGFLKAAAKHGHYLFDKISARLTPREQSVFKTRIATSYIDLGYFEEQHGALATSLKAYSNSFKVRPSPKPLLAMAKAVVRSGRRTGRK